MTIHAISGYKTSRDYERLWELAQKASVICIVDMIFYDGGAPSRDVAHTLFRAGGKYGPVCELSARGIGYIFGDGKDDFVAQCAHHNVEFIEPNAVNAGQAPEKGEADHAKS